MLVNKINIIIIIITLFITVYCCVGVGVGVVASVCVILELLDLLMAQTTNKDISSTDLSTID